MREANSIVAILMTTQQNSRRGNVIYSKGNDHIIDAVRCAMLGREQGRLDDVREETVSLVPVMTNPVFL